MIYEIRREKKAEVIEQHLNLGGENKHTKIEINNKYLIKNGIPWIPIVGEMHYVRVAEEDWEEELQKMRAGGITTVSTYVIWIYHEQNENEFCFTGNRNLRKFVQIAEKCGLSVFLRIGPWVHGEVRNGGFPDWLVGKGIPLRCNDEIYIQYVKRFYQMIYEQIKEYLFYKEGPIWGIQLENELTDKPEHLFVLKKLAEQIGLRVPIYTVTGWNSKYGAQIPKYEVLPVFGGYPEAPWENHKEKLAPNVHYFFLPMRNDSSIGNDLLQKELDETKAQINYNLYPFATCELGGGVAVTYHRRPNLAADDVSSIAMVKLGCGNNMPGYYMYKGGINDITDITLQESKATGYPNDYPVRNYDFQAPIGAYGEIRAAWRKLKLQHLFLESYGHILAPMETFFQKKPVMDRNNKSELRYCVRTDGETGFVFVNNYQRLDKLNGHTDVQFEVPCKQGKMIFPKTAMNVPSGSYFFLPYNLKIESILIKYATTQLLYRLENTVFFFSVQGVEIEYCIEYENGNEEIIRPDQVQKIIQIQSLKGETIYIVTLTQKEAECFYSTGKEIYIIPNADVYKRQGELIARQENDYRFQVKIWRKDRFTDYYLEAKEYRKKELLIKKITKTTKESEMGSICEKELYLGGEKRVSRWKIRIPEIDSDEKLFLKIEYIGDVLQIYINKILVADEFYRGQPFMISMTELKKYGDELELWLSELKEGDCYLETEKKKGLELRKISLVPVYMVKLVF